MSGRQGFSLVELIVAMTIIAVGLMALAGTAAVAHRSFIVAEAVERGTAVAAVVLDSLIREPSPVSGERDFEQALARWSVVRDSIETAISLTVDVVHAGKTEQLVFRATHHAK